MPAASHPPAEAERQHYLDSLALTDTQAEEVFDRVTRLVSRLLQVPTALFTLIDKDRQCFKSRVGMLLDETPRAHAFCAHAILLDQPLIVADATLDARFADNPLVTGAPHIRFYAGVPIRSSAGLAIGTLCALDTAVRVLSADELCVLIDLAGMVQKEIQSRERLALANAHLLRSEQVMAANEARIRSVFELAATGIALVAPDGRWLSVNKALCDMLGYSQQQLQGMRMQQITHPDDRGVDHARLAALRSGAISHAEYQKRYVRQDGTTVWAHVHLSRKLDQHGAIDYWITVIQDIGPQKAAEEALGALHAELEERVAARTAELRARARELSSVIENANDAYIGLDQDSIVTVWNRAAEDTFGYTAPEAIGREIGELIIPPTIAAAHHAGFEQYLRTGHSSVLGQRLELPAVRKDGSLLTIELRISALTLNGKTSFSAFLHDISARKQAEARREYESRHDALTGLLNRRALLETLPIAQSRASRSGQRMALLFIDLDGFKAVNDGYGHEAGDVVLSEVARRLHDVVRKTDSVFRLAGDEFTVLLEAVADGAVDAHAVGQKIIAALAPPVATADALHQIGASIGVALYTPGDAVASDDLIREADRQMYAAKRAGKGRVFPAPGAADTSQA